MAISEPPDHEPRHVQVEVCKECVVEYGADDGGADEREGMDAGCERGGTADELKVEREQVDGDDDTGEWRWMFVSRKHTFRRKLGSGRRISGFGLWSGYRRLAGERIESRLRR